MGARGPQKKPADVKVMEGNPGNRPIPTDFVEPNGDATRPAFLIGHAAEVWDRIVGAMPAGVYKSTDREMLVAYCLAADSLRAAVMHLWLEGEVITVMGQYGPIPRRNPWTAIRTEAMAKIISFGSHLGLSPTARENIKAPKGKPAGKFAGLVGIDGGKKR